MATIQLNVTQEDIDRGMPQEMDRCPIALCLQRLGYDNLSVGEDEVHFTREVMLGDLLRERQFTSTLPEIARWFIYKFDCGFKRPELQPISFEIQDPFAEETE